MLQYRMPAEWEFQDAMWFSWPWNPDTWPDNLKGAQLEFEELIRTVAAGQRVNVLTGSNQVKTVRERFAADSNVFVIKMESNDAWCRDYGPTFVIGSDSKLAAVDWYYNGWGEKYPPFTFDQQVAKQIADRLEIRHIAAGVCLEGGAIEVDGRGTLLTTESCVLNANRNAGLTHGNAEAIFRERLGCDKVIWLPGDIEASPALAGDDTDGHIDQLARFVDHETIVHAWVKESDVRFDTISANVRRLKEQLPRFRFQPLMLPQAIESFGRTIPASYCNFLITNDSVVVPQFEVPEDQMAISTLGSIIKNRNVIPLPSRHLSVGLGSFHCLSQQQPGLKSINAAD